MIKEENRRGDSGKEKKDKPNQKLEELENKVKKLEQKFNGIELEIKNINSEASRSLLLDKLEKIRVELGEARAVISILVEFNQDEKLQWLYLRARVDGLNTKAESLYRRIKDVVFPDSTSTPNTTSTLGSTTKSSSLAGGDSGSIDIKTKIEKGEYPHMGKYDTAKRLLLSPDVGLFKYEEVKDWGYNDVVQALLLFIKDYQAREFFGDDPFIALDLLARKIKIYTDKGDLEDITLKDAVTDLGMRFAQSFHDYQIGAPSTMFQKAKEHQSQRIVGGNGEDVINTTTLSKSKMLGLFTTEGLSAESESVVFRARGVPFTNASLIRFLLTAMYNRGEINSSSKPTPFATEVGDRPKYRQAKKELVAALFEILKYVRDKHHAKLNGSISKFIEEEEKPDIESYLDKALPISPDWESSDDVFLSDDVLMNVATSVFIESFNLGDILLFRAIADHDHKRHDELELAQLMYLRASIEKYLELKDGYPETGGQLKVPDKAILAKFEALYIPVIKRTRTRPIYIYKNADGEIRVGAKDRQLLDAIRDFAIPITSPVSKEVLGDIQNIYAELEELDNKLFFTNDKLNDDMNSVEKKAVEQEIAKIEEEKLKFLKELKTILDPLVDLSSKIPLGDDNKPYQGGLILTSVSDLITEHYAAGPDLETKVINHVKLVKEFLTSYDLDFNNMVVEIERDLFGGKFVSFSEEFGQKLRKIRRQAFYYWSGDHDSLLSLKRYQELVKNYSPPDKDSYTTIAEFNKACALWKREWSWRGVPLANYKRNEKGEINYETSEFHESTIGHLFNFQVDWKEKQKIGMEISKKEIEWHSKDWDRLINADNQPGQFLKIMVEKVVIMNIKQYLRGNEWTNKHTKALSEALSSELYERNRKGVRGLVLRNKTGTGGFIKGTRDRDHGGLGQWTPKEVDEMIGKIVGDWRAHTPDKFSKDK